MSSFSSTTVGRVQLKVKIHSIKKLNSYIFSVVKSENSLHKKVKLFVLSVVLEGNVQFFTSFE